jgi:hypothetical protein
MQAPARIAVVRILRYGVCMSNELVTGVCILRLNGKSIRSMEGASLDMGGFERKARQADGITIGFSRKPVESMVKAELVHTSLTDLDAINDLNDGTLVFECDSGVVFTLANVFSVKPPSLKGGDSSAVSVEFASPSKAVRTS